MAISKEKRNAYLAEWREKNREKIRSAQKRYYQSHKDECTAAVISSREKKPDYYTPEYFSANTKRSSDKDIEAHAARRRAYYAANSAKEIERVRRRQGRIRQGETLMSRADMAEVQGMYDFCRIFKGFEVDHIVPLNGKTVSGLHVVHNMQILPVSENRRKGNKHVT